MSKTNKNSKVKS